MKNNVSAHNLDVKFIKNYLHLKGVERFNILSRANLGDWETYANDGLDDSIESFIQCDASEGWIVSTHTIPNNTTTFNADVKFIKYYFHLRATSRNTILSSLSKRDWEAMDAARDDRTLVQFICRDIRCKYLVRRSHG